MTSSKSNKEDFIQRSLKQLEIQGIYNPENNKTMNTIASRRFKVIWDKIEFEAKNEKAIRELEEQQ